MEKSRTTLRPANVVADKVRRQVRIEWNDGHKSLFSFEQLRAACPCAGCRALKQDSSSVQHVSYVDRELDSAQLVGNYAIRFYWNDGHDFGIFSWDYLRSLG